MANAIGGELNISGLEEGITRLEKKLTSLSRNLTTNANKMQKAFEKISTEGVGVLSSRLDALNSSISKIGTSVGLVQLSQQAKLSADDVNKLIQTLAQLNASQLSRLGNQQNGLDYKRHANDIKELMNIERERSRELTRQNKKNISDTRIYSEQLKTATMRAIAGEKEKQAEIKRSIAEINRLAKAYKSMPTKISADGVSKVLGQSGGASTINQRLTAIHNLRNAIKDLDKNDSHYKDSLSRLNAEIKRHQRELRQAKLETNGLQGSHRALQGTLGQLQRQFLALYSVSAIKGYVNKLVQVRGEFEMQRTALASLLASKDEANELWDKTLQLAVRSPFTIKELITYTKQLAAYRVESSKLYETNKMLADVSAGLGVDMQRLILAYGQVKAATYLRGTELRQFTEAGVNMLKELADIYSETEGRMVSTGDVFERISKRMVVFEDVEKVFKRLTSEGGLFYQMQEKQSQTLRGQIMNLKDSIDIMLNDIAQQNDWVISKMLSLIKTAITNWRALAVAIEGVATLMITMGITKFVIGWQMVAKVGAEAALAMNGIVGAGARAKVAIQALWGMLVSHPIIAVIAGVVALGAAIYQLWDAHDSMVEKYDELSRAEVGRINNLSKMNDKIQENNKRIRDSSKALEKTQAGTIEYSEAKKANSVAINDNINALNELKSKYPELADAIKVAKDGTIDLTQAMEHQRLKAQLMIVLNDAMKADSWFTEDFKADLADTLQAQTEVTKSLGNLQVAATNSGVELQNAFRLGKIDETQYKTLEKLLGNITNAKNYDEAKKAIEELSEGTKQWGNSYAGTINGIKNGTIEAWGDLKSAQDDYFDEWGENAQVIEEVSDLMVQTIQKMYNTQTEEGKKAGGKFVDSVLESIGIADKEMKQWGRDIIEKKIKLIYVNEGEDSELTGWQKDVADAMTNQVNLKLDMLQMANVRLPSMSQDRKAYQEYVKGLIDENKKIIETSKIANQKIYNEAQINAAKEKESWLKLAGQIAGIDELEKPKKTSESIWEQRISLLKELRREYENLSKTFNKTTSRQKVMNGYMEAANELFKDLGIDISQIPFDDLERMSAFVSELMKQVEEGSKDEIKLGKLKGFFDVDIETKDTKDYQEQLIKQMQNLFDNYELGKELEKLHLPKDLMKQLFDVDVLNLDELRDRITSMDISNFGEDALKEYDKLLDKIREMELKEQEERMKMYSKYLIKAQNERVKIKMDELKHIQDIEKTFAFNDDNLEGRFNLNPNAVDEFRTQLSRLNVSWDEAFKHLEIYRDLMLKVGFTDEQINQLKEYNDTLKQSATTAKIAVRKESKEKLDKQAWKDFTGSDYYIEIFADLDKVSTSVIKSMMERLKSLKGSLKLDPTEMKQVVDAMEKMDKEVLSREGFSFKKIIGGVKDYIEYLRERNDLEEQYNASQERIKNLEFNRDMQIDAVAKTKEEYDLAVKTYGATSDQAVALSEELIIKKAILDATLDQLVAEGKISAEYAQQIKDGETIGVTLEERLKKNAQDLNEGFSAFEGMMQSIQSVTGSFGEDANDFIENVGKVVGGIATVENGLSQVLDGKVITGALNMVSGAFQSIGGLFGFVNNDKKKERQIQREIEFVEKLEKAYEKLEKAIEKAYAVDTLKMSYDEAQKNINKQIASYNEMIALEESKKDTDSDKIDEWKDKIEELRETQKQLLQDQVESLGGSYDIRSTTREFVDAWLDAFKETGDGLQGLKDNFKEFFQNILLEQAVMTGGATIMEDLLNEINSSLADDFEIDSSEYDVIKQKGEITMKQLNDFLNGLLGEGGLFNEFMTDAGDSLSGLQRGIQGITEAQADIIAAYLNSLRFYVADSNTKLTQLVDMQTNDSIPNPMLAELKAQTELIRSIRDMFSGVIRGGHPTYGGSFIKVAL